MAKKLNKTDLLFIISLIVGILSLSIYLFTYPYLYDETFYTTIPYRLVNGDSLIQHEWHLSQFSSLFSYLPVLFWLTVKGSSEGIIVFLRCVYFIIHTATTIVIYKYFRKYKSWAIAAAMIFFTQVPYRIFGISYHSVFVLCLLFFVLCLLSIYQKKSKHLYVIAGFCFGCCCVCNPLYCLAYFFYLVACALWKRRNSFKKFFLRIHLWYISKKEKNTIHKKQKEKRKKKKTQVDIFPDLENYSCFFCKDAIVYSFLGILSIALIAIVFFIFTGGTIPSLFRNIQNLLSSSEYQIISVSKIEATFSSFNKLNFNIPFLLPLFYIVLFLDNKRKSMSHRYPYLILSHVIAIAYALNIIRLGQDITFFFSLPLLVFSSVCYILTHKKNTVLFHCMWIPSLTAAFFQYLSSNTYFSSLGFLMALNNIAGVIFVRDLFYEIKLESTPSHNSKTVKSITYILCTGLCLQFVFHMFIFQYGQLPNENMVKATSGPYAGIIMTEQKYQNYENIISDIDYIKSLNTENSPVLIDSYQNWIYMHTEAPIATYTTWYRGTLHNEQLAAYYKHNRDKIPKYIYIDPYNYDINFDSDITQNKIEWLSEMFEFTQEELSYGLLLTVEKYKF